MRLENGVKTMKNKLYREIKQDYLSRSLSVHPKDVGSYLDSTAVALHQSLDAWRFHGGPEDEVAMCIDALVALWTSVETRSNNA